MRPASAHNPPSRMAHIGELVAELDIQTELGMMSKPDSLARAIRQEMLPALPDIFEELHMAQMEARIEVLEIDLGHWPAAPDWPALREVLAQKLRAALQPYLTRRAELDGRAIAARHSEPKQVDVPPDSPVDATNSEFMKQAKEAEILRSRARGVAETIACLSRDETDILATLEAHIARHSGDAEALIEALFSHDGGWAFERAQAPDVIADIWQLLHSARLSHAAKLGASTGTAEPKPAPAFRTGRSATTPTVPPQPSFQTHLQAALVANGTHASDAMRRAERIAKALHTALAAVPHHLSTNEQADGPARPVRMAELSQHSETLRAKTLLQTEVVRILDLSGSAQFEALDQLFARDPQAFHILATGLEDVAEQTDGQLVELFAAWIAGRPLISETLRLAWLVVPEQTQRRLETLDGSELDGMLRSLLAAKSASLRGAISELAREAPQILKVAVGLSLTLGTEATDDIAMTLLALTGSNPSQSIRGLKRLWKDRPATMVELISHLTENQLGKLIKAALPPQSTQLQEAINHRVKAARDPAKLQLRILRHLLEEVPIDFDALETDKNEPVKDLLSLLGVPPMLKAQLVGDQGSLNSSSIKGSDPKAAFQGRSANYQDNKAALTRAVSSLKAFVNIALDEMGTGGKGSEWRHALSLIWQAMPKSSSVSRSSFDSADATRDPHFWRVMLGAALAPKPKSVSLRQLADELTELLEPDVEKRLRKMRVAIARLRYADPHVSPALRKEALAALEAISDANDSIAGTAEQPASEVNHAAQRDQLTQVAGIVLVHPYLTLLFERLDLLDETKALPSQNHARALAALYALTGYEGAPDPLHLSLLGLRIDKQNLRPATLSDDEIALIDGLLEAVVAQWGALGSTTADGLRETFLIRDGTLSFDATGAALSVAPGPFDMLLDRLPWSVSIVALPWMPLPCHVEWRTEHD
ncbi:MAG: contractile injection system tape measure protein [Litoreibacter sp.]|nr:contractile injection system tape measure protein [Litoreibacter sp.]